MLILPSYLLTGKGQQSASFLKQKCTLGQDFKIILELAISVTETKIYLLKITRL